MADFGSNAEWVLLLTSFGLVEAGIKPDYGWIVLLFWLCLAFVACGAGWLCWPVDRATAPA